MTEGVLVQPLHRINASLKILFCYTYPSNKYNIEQNSRSRCKADMLFPDHLSCPKVFKKLPFVHVQDFPTNKKVNHASSTQVIPLKYLPNYLATKKAPKILMHTT